MRFTKMQGAGNDYVYVDCFREKLPTDPSQLAIQMSNRHFGVGSDGLILIGKSDKADARMRMFNADGSEAEMCGNGLRCVAKYVYDHDIAKKDLLSIETGNGVLTVGIEAENGIAHRVRVNMGKPILDAAAIPTTLSGNPPLNQVLEYEAGNTLLVNAVSMGNPHAVIFVDKITDEHVHQIGPKIEVHSAFPRKVNVEFVQVKHRSMVKMRVWERGSGETMACGTGACAVVVAGILTDRLERRTTVQLLGGELDIEWSEQDGNVYMTGPAVEVFHGEWLVHSS